MPWVVEFEEEFEKEFDGLAEAVQDELAAQAQVLEKFGPTLGRPRVDSLKSSQYPNMKELRFDAANGVWRVAFAFDPQRKAMLLVAGDKSGVSQSKFYKRLIDKADRRFSAHLAKLESEKKGKRN